ncbi:hypothetical protein LguiB_008605 [Lonicera macranthoides]
MSFPAEHHQPPANTTPNLPPICPNLATIPHAPHAPPHSSSHAPHALPPATSPAPHAPPYQPCTTTLINQPSFTNALFPNLTASAQPVANSLIPCHKTTSGVSLESMAQYLAASAKMQEQLASEQAAQQKRMAEAQALHQQQMFQLLSSILPTVSPSLLDKPPILRSVNGVTDLAVESNSALVKKGEDIVADYMKQAQSELIDDQLLRVLNQQKNGQQNMTHSPGNNPPPPLPLKETSCYKSEPVKDNNTEITEFMLFNLEQSHRDLSALFDSNLYFHNQGLCIFSSSNPVSCVSADFQNIFCRITVLSPNSADIKFLDDDTSRTSTCNICILFVIGGSIVLGLGDAPAGSDQFWTYPQVSYTSLALPTSVSPLPGASSNFSLPKTPYLGHFSCKNSSSADLGSNGRFIQALQPQGTPQAHSCSDGTSVGVSMTESVISAENRPIFNLSIEHQPDQVNSLVQSSPQSINISQMISELVSPSPVVLNNLSHIETSSSAINSGFSANSDTELVKQLHQQQNRDFCLPSVIESQPSEINPSLANPRTCFLGQNNDFFLFLCFSILTFASLLQAFCWDNDLLFVLFLLSLAAPVLATCDLVWQPFRVSGQIWWHHFFCLSCSCGHVGHAVSIGQTIAEKGGAALHKCSANSAETGSLGQFHPHSNAQQVNNGISSMELHQAQVISGLQTSPHPNNINQISSAHDPTLNDAQNKIPHLETPHLALKSCSSTTSEASLVLGVSEPFQPLPHATNIYMSTLEVAPSVVIAHNNFHPHETSFLGQKTVINTALVDDNVSMSDLHFQDYPQPRNTHPKIPEQVPMGSLAQNKFSYLETPFSALDSCISANSIRELARQLQQQHKEFVFTVCVGCFLQSKHFSQFWPAPALLQFPALQSSFAALFGSVQVPDAV